MCVYLQYLTDSAKEGNQTVCHLFDTLLRYYGVLTLCCNQLWSAQVEVEVSVDKYTASHISDDERDYFV